MELVGIGGEKFSGKNTASQVLIEHYGFKEYSLAKSLKELVSDVFDIPYENLDKAELKEVPFEQPRPVTYDNVHDIVRRCSNLIGFESFSKNEESVTRNMLKKVVKKISVNPQVPQVTQQGQQGLMQPMMMPRPEYKTFETPRKLLQFVGTDLVRDCISAYFWCKVLDNQIQYEEKVVLTDVRFFEEREYVKLKHGLLVKVERDIPGAAPKKDGHASENSLGGNDEYHYLIRNNGTVESLWSSLETIYNHQRYIKADKIYRIQDNE